MQTSNPVAVARNQIGQSKKEIVISVSTRDRVEACKTYIESKIKLIIINIYYYIFINIGKYAKMITDEVSKKQNWE